MKNRVLVLIAITTIATLVLLPRVSSARNNAKSEVAPASMAASETSIQEMDKALKGLLTEQERAKKIKDLHLLNCISTKVDQIQGLLTASLRAKNVMVKATFTQDHSTASSYAAKIASYRGGADEVLSSLQECYEGESSATGISLVYIHPEGSPLSGDDPLDPWSEDLESGAGVQFPVVPPASPFR